jgi:epoxyqueuosine reductase
MSLKNDIKAEANRLGFPLIGFTHPLPPAHIDVFRDWIQAGRHAGMQYLASEPSLTKRADPQKILPECKTIISLGFPYPSPLESHPLPSQKLQGRIAAYAWVQDYHDTLIGLLQQLVVFIELKLGHSISQRIYTDTGPILEREFGQQAGLGWIGKNSCLISPVYGSFFFLAEILLDEWIEPDQAFQADRCGSCNRCIQACPTGCILPDRTLDASRCLSYLTIENKGSIPRELRPRTSNWIFGCDLCQMVCPWNLHAGHKKNETCAALTVPDPFPPLLEEFSLSQQDFSKKYQHSPVLRAKRKGYLRNIAVALGNSAEPSSITTLAQVLKSDDDPLIREHAAWALGQINTSLALQILKQHYLVETVEEVRGEIKKTLDPSS